MQQVLMSGGSGGRWDWAVRTFGWLLAAAVMAGTSRAAVAADDLRGLARTAVSEDPDAAQQAADALRAAGPRGLGALLTEFAKDLSHAGEKSSDPRARRRLSAAIDRVAGQRDARASGLYWYTDLEQAKAAARAGGKPILSLRLLGRLDDEYSCANSRFFRTVLYANGEVSKALRERFVLHWKSVRPVPVVTIDMGDGRTIRRTITGNSIHYVLDADGRTVDAIPGLYGPATFLRVLAQAEAAERELRGLTREAWANAFAAWHGARSRQIASDWAADLERIGIDVAPLVATEAQTGPIEPGYPASGEKAAQVNAAQARARRRAADHSAAPDAAAGGDGAAPPTAAEAVPLAIGKSAAEAPLVAALSYDPAALTSATDDTLWDRIAALHADEARLDPASRRFMAPKLAPAADEAGQRAPTKRRVEDPLLRVVRNFERSLALDTVRNEYTFHRQIHDWFAAGPQEAADVERLNERIYAELFLTPSSDPWLGLVPPDTYSALDEDGLGELSVAAQ